MAIKEYFVIRNDDGLKVATPPFKSDEQILFRHFDKKVCKEFIVLCAEEKPEVFALKIQAVYGFDIFMVKLGRLFGFLNDYQLQCYLDFYEIDEVV